MGNHLPAEIGQHYKDARESRANSRGRSAMPLFDISFRCPTIRVVSITPRRRNRQSMRLRDYDYTTAGAYFVTVCTQERQCSLEDPVWQSVVRTAWRRAVCGGTEPSPYDFVIMPNHVHGIAWLPAGARRRPTVVGTQRPGNDGLVVSGVALVGERRSDIGCAAPLRARLKAGSLGAVVRAFKSASTGQDQPRAWHAGRCRLAA